MISASSAADRANSETLRRRELPAWFDDAKLGIFIHWGLFSIPAFAPRVRHVSDAVTQHYPLFAAMTPYTEWYDNALRVPESPAARHHAEHWAGRPYAEFREPFLAGLEKWDPQEWAALFRRAGARYVVLVTKHHDGFCLWPSRVANPQRGNWFAPRDIVGELAAAVRAAGMRFGVYYSGGIDWTWNPRPVRTLIQFIASVPRGGYPAYAEAQVRELIDRYQPSVLWNDISWPTPTAPMLRLFADFYAAVVDGVVNDRWMPYGAALRLLRLRPFQMLADAWLERQVRSAVARGEHNAGIVPPLPVHCDFRTPEYTSFDQIETKKWEATRGMSASFGYNRGDREEDYEDPVGLVRSFIDIVAKNGNLLLNVGPRGEDAAIPEPQVRRLEVLGDWLAENGEAVFATRPWRVAALDSNDGTPLRFTRGADAVYVVVLATNSGPLSFDLPFDVPCELRATRLADGAPVSLACDGRRVTLTDAQPRPATIARAFALRGAGL